MLFDKDWYWKLAVNDIGDKKPSSSGAFKSIARPVRL